MDSLIEYGVEPQLAIPVFIVVVLASLVYIFGFQKTEEPSSEHLAVLQSSSYKNRSNNNLKQKTHVTNNNKVPTKAKEKSVANGHVVSHEKTNGAIKGKNVALKEGKPDFVQRAVQAAKKEKKPTNKPEDFDAGM